MTPVARRTGRPRSPVVDRPGWVDANASGMAALLDPLVDALTEKQDSRPGAAGHRDRLPGHRRAGRRRPGLPVRARARPVRGLRHRRPAAAGRAEHRRRPSASSASTRATSGSGSACTRSPTAPVHRGAVAAGATSGEVAGSSTPPTSTPTCCASGCRTCCAASADAVRGDDGELRGAHGADHATPRSAPSSTGSPR